MVKVDWALYSHPIRDPYDSAIAYNVTIKAKVDTLTGTLQQGDWVEITEATLDTGENLMPKLGVDQLWTRKLYDLVRAKIGGLT